MSFLKTTWKGRNDYFQFPEEGKPERLTQEQIASFEAQVKGE